MNLDEMRALSDADVRARVTEMEEERFRLKFRGATETLQDPLRLRTIRRDIARLLTVLREREIAAGGETRSPKARRRANRRKSLAKPAAKSAAKRRTKRAAKSAR